MDILLHLGAHIQTQRARKVPAPRQSIHLIHHQMRALAPAPPRHPPQHPGTIAPPQRIVRVRQQHGGDGAAQGALGGGGGVQSVQKHGLAAAGPHVLPEAGLGEVVARHGGEVQAVAGGGVVGEEAVGGGGGEDGGGGVGEVEEERVEEGGGAVGGEDLVGG